MEPLVGGEKAVAGVTGSGSGEDGTPGVSQLMSLPDLTTMFLYTFSTTIPICIFGIFSNLANIIVFYKMGFASPSNINLFCLAIADLLTLAYILSTAVGNHPLFSRADLTFSMADVARTGALAYYSFSAMGSWITAVINVERSCCIAFPMKVKGIFTRKTIVSLIAGMVIYQLASGLPRSFGVRFIWSTSPLTNRTKIRYDIFKPKLVTTSIFASFSFPTIICFGVVVVGTIFLISKFKQSRKLRGSMTTSGGEHPGKLSEKDVKLVRSVIFICIIYIIGATPNVVIFLVSTAFPTLHYDDPYLGNLMLCLLIIGNGFQAMSCSANIFVYLGMGSKFKQTFKKSILCQSGPGN